MTIQRKQPLAMRCRWHKIVIAIILILLTGCALLFPRRTTEAQAPGSGPYQVFAHYMPNFPPLGINPANNYWYTVPFDPADDRKGGLTARPILYSTGEVNRDLNAYVADIQLAKQYGIDGFFVDQLEDNDQYRSTWQQLLKAAEIVGDFKIGLMPDYATLGSNPTYGTLREKVKHWLDVAGSSPALLRYDGKPVVAVYGVGHPNGMNADGSLVSVREKKYLVDWLASQGTPVSYMATHGLNWALYTSPYGKDPVKGFHTFAFGTGSFSPLVDSSYHQRALDYWPSNFMQMGENSFIYNNRNWRYATRRLSTHYRDQWMWNINNRDRIRWMQLITWNDWGETAIAPSNNHFMAWQPITKYYADWFKTGVQPTISKDVVTIFHRPHPYKANPSPYTYKIGSEGYCECWVPTDEVEALAMLTAPATIILNTGGTEYRQDVGAGIQSLIEPFALGVQSARIERDGVTIASVTSPVPIHDQPARQNLWFIGADSLHPPQPIPTDNWNTMFGTWSGTNSARRGYGVSLVGEGSQLGNYQISAKVTPSFAADGTSAGLVVRAWNNGSQYYSFAIGKWNGASRWRISKSSGGVETEVVSGSTTYAANQARTLRLDAVGEYLIAYLDNQLVSANVSDYKFPYGQAGVSAINASATFTNISVKYYDPDLLN